MTKKKFEFDPKIIRKKSWYVNQKEESTKQLNDVLSWLNSDKKKKAVKKPKKRKKARRN